jgi:hypothetical protein
VVIPRHSLAGCRLSQLLHGVLPLDVEALQITAIEMPDGDGLVPDLLVTTEDPRTTLNALPPRVVHTVVEVVEPGSTRMDRLVKPHMYADAGIRCYWRVELERWDELPVVVDADGTLVHLKIDPAELVGPRRG